MDFDLTPLLISLKTALVATLITFFLGLAAARWMLTYRGRSKAIIDGVLIAPLVLPPTVLGFLLLLIFGKNGFIGQLLEQFFQTTVIFSWSATVITATVVAFPLMYRTALGAFEQIEANLMSAARTLGASEWQIFWRVMVPLSLPGIIAGTILSFARALGEFGATLMLAGNIPGKTQTIPMAIYFQVEAGDYRTAGIWVAIILILSLGVITSVNFWQKSTPRFKRSQVKVDRPKTNYHPQIPISQEGLIVEIQRQLTDFQLDVRFTANQEALGLLGASGSGKSMTLRCIAGLETPSQGCIVLNQRVLFDAKRGINVPARDRNIGYLFQNYALFPHLTVAQNIAFGLQNLSVSQQRQRVSEQLSRMHLQGLENRYPHQLSGGQQQRVALARALAIQPEVLLLDEPFSALDTYLRNQLEQQLIEVLKTYQGIALFVTHNLEEAYRVCQNLLVMDRGNIAQLGSRQQIFERPETFAVAQITGCKNFSRSQIINAQKVQALDWGCTLETLEPIPENLAYVGIRAHHLTFPSEAESLPNCFPCWIAEMTETQHRVTLYLKLNHEPESPADYHLQAEVYKEKWAKLKEREFPWQIHLHPLHLMLLSE